MWSLFLIESDIVHLMPPKFLQKPTKAHIPAKRKQFSEQPTIMDTYKQNLEAY